MEGADSRFDAFGGVCLAIDAGYFLVGEVNNVGRFALAWGFLAEELPCCGVNLVGDFAG